MGETAKYKGQTDVIGITDNSDMANICNLITMDIGQVELIN